MTRLAILGATGAVGSTLLRVLEERSFPLDELRLLASERSAGRQIPHGGRDLTVQAVGPSSFVATMYPPPPAGKSEDTCE